MPPLGRCGYCGKRVKGGGGVCRRHLDLPYRDPNHELFWKDGAAALGLGAENPDPAPTGEPPARPSKPRQVNNRYDSAERRATVRRGGERGAWLYLPAVELEKAGYSRDEPPPFSRVWAGPRGRVVVQLYRHK